MIGRAIRRGLACTVFLVAGCAPLPTVDVPSRQANLAGEKLPPMKTFAPRPVSAPLRSNAEMARDFIDLSFRMESGRKLDILTRFEGQITLRVLGDAPVSLAPDLSALLSRLRDEAGIEIAMTGDPSANITIFALEKAKMQRVVPGAACFVVPNVRDWDDFKRARRSTRVDWTRLARRQQVAIFVPSDAAPQELRDCLHEEVAQALGPLNDLYRLPDSVFNDDNFHTVLTGFDMLILRAYYSPELRNGMSEDAVRAALPRIFARLNPRGERGSAAIAGTTSPEWKESMLEALGSVRGPLGRKAAAQNAIAISRSRGWDDARLGFANYALGRLTIASEPQRSFSAFMEADRVYSESSVTELHRAYVAVQLAAFSLLDGDALSVMNITAEHMPVAAKYKNAALLASLLMFRAEALEVQGRAAEARAVRLDSLGWARYGFGSVREVNARLREISLLNPVKHGRFSY